MPILSVAGGDPGPGEVTGQHNERPGWTKEMMDLVRNKSGGVKRIKLLTRQEYDESQLKEQGPMKRQKREVENVMNTEDVETAGDGDRRDGPPQSQDHRESREDIPDIPEENEQENGWTRTKEREDWRNVR